MIEPENERQVFMSAHATPNRPVSAIRHFVKEAGSALVNAAEAHQQIASASRNGGQITEGFTHKPDAGRSL
jgi:hypothetical protein